MRILFISPRQCWPVLSGAKLREYRLAMALGTHASLTYVFFSDPELPQPGPADMPFCEEIISVPQPDRYSGVRIVRGLLGRWPLPVENHTSPQMKAVASRLAASGRFDFVHMDGTHLAAVAVLLGSLPNGPRIVFDWHNIESEGLRRYADTTPSRLKRIYAGISTRRMESVERMLLRACFGHIVCSDREREQLLPLAVPGARIAVIENGVDAAYFEAPETDGSRNRIVFVGAMNYHANIDAIIPFARRVWPRIRDCRPEWKLTIVGSKPSQAVLDLRREPGVEVTGTVDDVRPYYREALAAVVPLRTGTGTRLKILEAMAAGVPVVSTAIGAEGLAVTPGRDILIAREERDWSSALEALADMPLRRRLVAAGRDLVRSRYDWRILEEALCNTYRQWLNQ
jgi:glycosyltransferase involved in cell wall biosynthesis